MGRLLSIEWLKLKGYRPFWVFFSLYPLTFLGIFYLVFRSYQVFRPEGTSVDALAFTTPPFQFPGIWQTSSYIASFFHFLPCLVVMLSVTNEFSFRTHRQNLIDGWSRSQFLLAKGLLVLGAALVSTVWVGLTGLAFGFSQGGSLSTQGLQYLGYFFLQSTLYASFALWLAFLLRRGLLSLAAFLLYSNVLEKIGAAILNAQVEGLGYYAPLASVNPLIPMPMLPQVTRQLSQGQPAETSLLLAAVSWIAFFSLSVAWSFRSQDL